jgi:hypothetical protein
MYYEIRVTGHLSVSQWRDWFGSLTLENQLDGETRLYGPVADQAALHGILNRIRDLGLTLIFLRGEKIGSEHG